MLLQNNTSIEKCVKKGKDAFALTMSGNEPFYCVLYKSLIHYRNQKAGEKQSLREEEKK